MTRPAETTVSTDFAVPAGHSSRIIDGLLAALLVVRGGLPFATFGVPPADLVAIALIFLAITRRPTRRLRYAAWYPVGVGAIVVMLVLSGMLNDIDWVRRVGSVGISALLAVFVATGRLDIGALVKGMLVGLVGNAALFYAGIAPDTYGGVLTGYLTDKNVAGLYFAIIPLLALTVLHRRRHQLLVLAIGGAGLWLTGSRTSMAAFVAALVIVFVGRHLPTVLRLGLMGALIAAFFWVEENAPRIGPFADRTGSDRLRDRIQAAAELRTDAAPWYGYGPAQTHVEVQGRFWWYHDSYLAARAEGGWLLLLLVLALIALAVLLPYAGSATSRARLVVQATAMAALLMATQLGEVFFTTPVFLIIGVGMQLQLMARGEDATPPAFLAPGGVPPALRADPVRPQAG